MVIQENKLICANSLIASKSTSESCDTKVSPAFELEVTPESPNTDSDRVQCTKLLEDSSVTSKEELASSEESVDITLNLVGTQKINEIVPNWSTDVKIESDSDTSCYSMNDSSLKSVPVVLSNTRETHSEKKVPCEFCPKKFKFVASRNRHMKQIHPDLVYVCTVCKKLFFVVSEYTEHVRSKHPEIINQNSSGNSNMSSDIDNEFSNIPLLGKDRTCNSPLRFMIKEEPYATSDHNDMVSQEVTGDSIKTEGSITDGNADRISEKICIKLKRSHRKTRQIQVKDKETEGSDKTETYNSSRIDQITKLIGLATETNSECGELKHSSKRKGPVKCKIKSKRQSVNKEIETGESLDSCDGPIKCKYCSKMFPTKGQKKRHESAVHSPTTFHCQYCGKVYKRMHDLEDHERSHTGQRPFKCEVCDKAFFSKHNLRCHQNLHKTRGAFMCMYCGKEFDSKGGMEYHELSHTGIRTQQCKVCNKMFKHRSALITHERIHTDEKPYPCKYCTKRFRDNSTLRKHERIHTLEKPYKCEECDKAYNQRWCLRTHYVKSHAGVPIPVINPKYPMTL